MTEPIDTQLADLSQVSLADLRRPDVREQLVPYREVLVQQVERPRINLGTGPPGRAD